MEQNNQSYFGVFLPIIMPIIASESGYAEEYIKEESEYASGGWLTPI